MHTLVYSFVPLSVVCFISDVSLLFQTEAVVNQVRSFIDMHQVVCAGPFLYAHVQEVRPHSKKSTYAQFHRFLDPPCTLL